MAVLITSHKFCAGHVLYVFQLGHAHICVAPRVSWTLLKKPAELIQVRKQIHVQPLGHKNLRVLVSPNVELCRKPGLMSRATLLQNSERHQVGGRMYGGISANSLHAE